MSLVQDRPEKLSPEKSPSEKSSQGKTPVGQGSAKALSKDRDMGAALRSVWQKTVEESVPDDMLDLLGKLD